MSKYESQMGFEEGAICPYCKKINYVEYEDYSEELGEIKCNCGKIFCCSQQMNVQHDSYPDCELNGEEHQYRNEDIFCTICGKYVKEIIGE